MSDQNQSEHKKKKAAASSAVAVLTAASIMVAGADITPAQLVQGEDGYKKADHTFMMEAGAIDNGLEEYQEDEDEDDEDEEDETEETESALNLRLRIKKVLLSLPFGVRMVVVLPLWLLGSGLTFLGSSLWGAASPVVIRVLSFALILAIIFGSFVVAAKVLHPELPLKKYLNKKTIPVLLIGGILLCILDLVLTILDLKMPIKEILVCIGHLALLSSALVVLTKHFQKTKQGRYAPLPPPKEKKEKPKREPAVVFTDATGTLQRIKFQKEEIN